ncbi:hypothetical protein KSD_94760 [Ktedonobacter sp. SOSP1-85]|nr:hypothetical protein KSD_94760 [Ktedonobacter sp. SOSP1-85]
MKRPIRSYEAWLPLPLMYSSSIGPSTPEFSDYTFPGFTSYLSKTNICRTREWYTLVHHHTIIINGEYISRDT